MDNTRIADNISEVIDASRKYAKANLKLFKLTILEQLSKVVSLIIATTLIMFGLAIVLLFLCIAGAMYLGGLFQSSAMGFLVMGLIFLVPVIILWINRKTLVINTVIRSLNDIVFTEDEPDEE